MTRSDKAALWVKLTLPGVGQIGPGKIELLRKIAELQSISAAARAMDMSYRRAWLLVDGIPTAPLTALVGWLAGLGQGTDELARVRAGARALAPRLSPLAARQLAVRLPRPIGLVVSRDIAPHLASDRGGTIPP